MDKSIEQLARDLAFAEYAKTTQASYLATIRALSERKKTPIASWSRDDLRETFEWLRSLGKSAAWLKSSSVP